MYRTRLPMWAVGKGGNAFRLQLIIKKVISVLLEAFIIAAKSKTKKRYWVTTLIINKQCERSSRFRSKEQRQFDFLKLGYEREPFPEPANVQISNCL